MSNYYYATLLSKYWKKIPYDIIEIEILEGNYEFVTNCPYCGKRHEFELQIGD